MSLEGVLLTLGIDKYCSAEFFGVFGMTSIGLEWSTKTLLIDGDGKKYVHGL